MEGTIDPHGPTERDTDALMSAIEKQCKDKLPPGITASTLAHLVKRLMKQGNEKKRDILELSGEALEALGMEKGLQHLSPNLIDTVVEKFSGKTVENAADIASELLKFLQEDGVKALRETIQGPPIQRTEPQIGRNDPCKCGSGKKVKRCCGGRH